MSSIEILLEIIIHTRLLESAVVEFPLRFQQYLLMLLLNSLKFLLGFSVDGLKLFLVVSIDSLLHLVNISSFYFWIRSWVSSRRSSGLLLHHWYGGWVQSWHILNRLTVSSFRVNWSDLWGRDPCMLWWSSLIPWWFWIGAKWVLWEATFRSASNSRLLCISIRSLAILFDRL